MEAGPGGGGEEGPGGMRRRGVGTERGRGMEVRPRPRRLGHVTD